MAQKVNTTLTNFVGGEVSPYMEGRVDLELFAKSLQWCENFLILPQGGATFRSGSLVAGLTKNNAVAALKSFQFSANDAYMMVLTDKKFRFYRNDAVILNTEVVITDITAADPAVVTAASHGFANGDEVYITGVEGMPQINNRFFLVANKATNTFELQDQWGTDVDSSLYDAYESDGTVAKIYELASPYLEDDLFYLRKAQTADTMYITSRSYAQRKLVRTAHTSWTLSKFTRTNDPFLPTASEIAITGMTAANPAVFTTATHGLVVGDRIYIEGTGTANVQNKFFRVKTVPLTTTFTLYYDDEVTVVDSTGWTHANGNTFVKLNKFPAVVGFSADGRAVFCNTADNPEGFWASRAPNGSTSRYDDFTTGTLATDAAIYNFAPVEGLIDEIQEIKQLDRQFVLLGASSLRRVYGASSDLPVTGLAVNAQPTMDGSAQVKPVVVGSTMLFVDVNGKKLKGFKYNLAKDGYETENYNLVADQYGEVAFKKLVRVKGDPDIIWVLRSDGLLLSFTFNDAENIAGWARHTMGGDGVVEDIETIRRDTGEDQLWMIVNRTINSKTYRTIEVMSARPVFPQRRAFYSGDKDADKEAWESATWEQLKDPTFLDMSLTFDGTARGIDKAATITPSATTGNSITITSDQAVFRADHIGRQIWKRYAADGSGGGQAEIVGFTSSTEVICDVLIDFDSTDAIAYGDWEFAVDTLQNLHMFEGVEMDIQADGSTHPALTVSSGAIQLSNPASRIHVGFKHLGFLATQNIDVGGRSGPANSKPRNIAKVNMRFKDSLGAKVGASEYTTQEVIYRETGQIMGRVPPPFTGVKELNMPGMWRSDSQQVVVLQEDPTPLTITAIDVEVATVDQT